MARRSSAARSSYRGQLDSVVSSSEPQHLRWLNAERALRRKSSDGQGFPPGRHSPERRPRLGLPLRHRFRGLCSPGSLVQVSDHRGKSLGTALYSSSSQIAIRMISSDRVADFPPLLRQRIVDAIAYRKPLVRDTRGLPRDFQRSRFPSRTHRRPLRRHSLPANPHSSHGRRSRCARRFWRN